jgi:hypothetical protein
MMQVDVENVFHSISQPIIFRRLCDAEGAFGEHYSIYQVVLWCLFFFLLPAWVACGKGHHYWIILK